MAKQLRLALVLCCAAMGIEIDPMMVSSWSHPSGGSVTSVDVSGDYAFIGLSRSDSAGLRGLFQVLDVSDPAKPRPLGSCQIGEWAHDIAVSGHYAYVLDVQLNQGKEVGGTLRVIDITDPSNPQIFSESPTADSGRSLAVSGDHIFIAAAEDGLQVIDTSDLANPRGAGF
jgi:hypothetical protein